MTDDIDKEKLEQLISQLEINVDNVYHLLLSNGMEMVGEIFPPEQMWREMQDMSFPDDDGDETFEEMMAEEDELELELVDDDGNEIEFDIEETPVHSDLLFLNPIKVYRDAWIDELGEFKHTNYFLEWNPCIDGPYTHINKTNIISMNKPNAETLVNYLRAIYQLYYPLLADLPEATNLSIIGERINLNEDAVLFPKNIIDFTSYHAKRLNGVF